MSIKKKNSRYLKKFSFFHEDYKPCENFKIFLEVILLFLIFVFEGKFQTFLACHLNPKLSGFLRYRNLIFGYFKFEGKCKRKEMEKKNKGRNPLNKV